MNVFGELLIKSIDLFKKTSAGINILHIILMIQNYSFKNCTPGSCHMLELKVTPLSKQRTIAQKNILPDNVKIRVT